MEKGILEKERISNVLQSYEARVKDYDQRLIHDKQEHESVENLL